MNFLKRLGLIFKWLIVIFSCMILILVLVAYFFPGNWEEPKTKPYPDSHILSFNKTNYHYRLLTPDTIVQKAIFIHGFSASTFSFNKTIDSLYKAKTQIIAIDVPGFGYSDKSKRANYTDTNFVNAIHYLINETDKNNTSLKWNVIGHSMGASLAGKFASKYPNDVKALIFIDGLPFADKHKWTQKLILFPPLLKLADFGLKRIFLKPKKFNQLLSSAYAQQADSASIYGYMNPFKIKGSGSGVFRYFAHGGYAKTDTTILNTKQQLVIWGTKDTWIPIKTADNYKLKKQVTFIEVRGAGHCPMETHAKIVNEAILNFISKLDAK